ncbi:class I SAM-dependent methyltransferase [uncultured Lamprocystis sp.]|uniref:class I SAM-dependent methyltransferase n=1 Tax=uncultured Lamprocystis sp. TaxID=543132 RepID=UPI0025E340C4|nr:class I SAM-dependent methyltransferase [uncultured Lamprocystis sp.]
MSALSRKLQHSLRLLERTPLHPQWLVLRHRRELAQWLDGYARGRLLDVGCGNGQLRALAPPSVTYVGLDYPPTIDLGYVGRPDILGDAARLPFRDACMDTVCLLDVLEHLADPTKALTEAARVLKADGLCLIHVPFIYPLHDTPHDFQRWTRHGLMRMLAACGLRVDAITETTTPIETGAAMLSMALAQASLDTLARPSLALLLAPLVILLCALVNLLGWLLARLLPPSVLMTFSYRVVASPIPAPHPQAGYLGHRGPPRARRPAGQYSTMTLAQLAARDRHLLALRARELRLAAALIGRTPQRILEIGGGNGWQARLLERIGHDVVSIDVAPRTDGAAAYPVLGYDGHHIPYGDGSFDVVFSSNVLEHIAHLDLFEMEIHRVLRPNGRAIHVLPTSAWRVWTSIAHPFRVIRAVRSLFNPRGRAKTGVKEVATHRWYNAFWPERHGERGNSLTEVYWFSKRAWTRHFEHTRWSVESTLSAGIFYTGQSVLHVYLGFSARRVLARYLGAATRIYVLCSADRVTDQRVLAETTS